MSNDTDYTQEIADLKAQIAALQSKNSELLTEKKAAKAAAEAAREAADTAEAEKANSSNNVEAIKSQYQKKLDAEKARADGFYNQIHALLVDRGIDEALTAANVAPAFKKAAAALLKTEHKIEIADGAATINGSALADFVGSWAKTDGAAYVAAPANGGGGSTGSSATAPAVFTKENFNSKLTEFMALAKTNKAEAIQIAQSIGRDDIAASLNSGD